MTPIEATQRGIVLRSTGSWYDIRTPEGVHWQGRLRGKLRLQGLKVTNPVAVGDWVQFQVEDPNESRAAITAIEDRQNYLVRESPRKKAHGHIIAANLDQVLVMATMVYPRTSSGFIDRVLVSAETFRIPALVVFNKSDLLDKKSEAQQNEWMQVYARLGYGVLSVSALEQQGLEEVMAALSHKKTLIVGHSGVGKSTLLNQIAPEINQRVQSISDFSEKGMHTTTFAEMFEIAPQTFLIDTPGIKEMGLLQIGNEELAHYFPEMRERLGQCRFHNCTHQHEPHCAIIAAVAAETISPTRYQNYLRMLL